MQTVDLSLMGRSYQVACAPGEEKRLIQLAGMLEEKMKLAASAGQGAIGEIRLFLLAGLMLADDVLESGGQSEKASNENKRMLLQEEDVLVSAVDHLAGRINALAARIEKA
jgi:cell division protein ZapA